MKILFFAEDCPPNQGGTSEYSINLARSIQQMGNEITLVAPHTSGDEVYDANSHIKTYRVGKLDSRQKQMGLWGRIIAVKEFERDINKLLFQLDINKSFDFAIISSVSTWANLCKKHNIPYGVCVHGGDAFGSRADFLRTIYRRYAVRRIFRQSKGVFSNSNYTKTKLLALGLPEKNVFTTYCGIAESFVVAANKYRDVPREPNQLLMMCRLVPIKACDVVIKAMVIVKKEFPNLKLIIAGDGLKMAELKALTHDLGVDNCIKFIGYVADIEKKAFLLRQSSLLIQSGRIDAIDNRAEAFGIVFAEAAICQCPAIGPRLGGVPEVIVDGKTGRLAVPDDVNSTADSITNLLTDRLRLYEMGVNAKHRAEKLFNYKNIAEKIVSTLKEYK